MYAQWLIVDVRLRQIDSDEKRPRYTSLKDFREGRGFDNNNETKPTSLEESGAGVAARAAGYQRHIQPTAKYIHMALPHKPVHHIDHPIARNLQQHYLKKNPSEE